MNDVPPAPEPAPKQSRRVAKASQAIKEVVSTTILFKLRDPRIKNVTVIRAEAAGDLRSAKVYLSVMGNAKTEALCLKGLESARGFLQRRIADRLQTRYTPVLSFRIDRGFQQSLATSRILREELGHTRADSTIPEPADVESATESQPPASSPSHAGDE